MKVAITADVHLKLSKEEGQARYNAFIDILERVTQQDIGHLIIAGDLFDKENTNYSLFDKIGKDYSSLQFYVIPGNHDPNIQDKHFTSENIQVFEEPEVVTFNDDTPFFFLPYDSQRSMGEILANYEDELPDHWVLIGHGDYMTRERDKNPYEPGIYMPLTRNDLETYQPAKVILGHIHKRSHHGKVHYVGSPAGLDINETGPRYFSVFDTSDQSITPVKVNTEHIYFTEQLITMPVDYEERYMKKQIEEMVENWEVKQEEFPKIQLRLKVEGFTNDKEQLDKIIRKCLEDINFYDKVGPNLSDVDVIQSPEREEIIEKVRQTVHNNQHQLEQLNISRNEVLNEALRYILQVN